VHVAVLLGLGLLVLALLTGIAGFSWNALVSHHYRQAYPVPGKFYSVDGGVMHIYCTGTGSPTLILDAGAGDDWTVWSKIQPELSKTTQVCTYDRSGLGSSDRLPGGHDANTLAEQLHTLIGQAGIKKPFLLAGHSIAGLYIRAYATKYPNDLAGLIFIDSSHPDQRKRQPQELRQDTPNFLAMRLRVRLGIARAFGECNAVLPGLEPVKGWIYANNCRPSVVDTWIDELNDLDRSADETRDTGPFDHLPILIFSEDPNVPREGSSLSPEKMKQVSIAWNQMQEDLKQLSADSRRIIAKGSSHYIQLDRPDLINRELPGFIDSIRHGRPLTDAGSTQTE
jgi:pimeloyl-ACP methyl ester carboxylesterase